ncbi:MAG: hypothetical protein CMG74_11495 [Candidatus Marinimicrobia bacterium]|nr:hypothetical protein [Candidatus Neomarinimicrobiota bacterium]
MTILDKYKWVARAWRYRLIIEKHEIRFLIKHLKPGQIAVDIGSHKGAYAFWMYKSLGNNGSVYAFEPQPQLYTTLKEIIDENEYNNIFLYPYAFSSKSGKSNLIIPKGVSSPSASIGKKKHPGDSIIEIKTTTLDDFFYKKKNISVDFIKCDVEGHELEVLHGGKLFFNYCRPIILIESEARHCGKEKVMEVSDFLKCFDYEGYFHNGNKIVSIENFRIFEYQLDPNKTTYVNNFFFLPK